MSLSEFSNSQRLQEILIAKINSSSAKQITFAEYMATVLYHPEFGYYTTKVKIGSQGDFFTSASLGRDFGEMLAIQFQEMWHNLGCPNSFSLVEMGAGNGELALDILSCLQANADSNFIAALKYIIVERSPALIVQQQEQLQPLSELKICWQDWSDISEASIVGCCFSNELVDAFPVHLVQKSAGKLQEVYLTVEAGQLSETIAPLSTEAIADYFAQSDLDLLAADYIDGYRTEVNLQALDWLATVANKLQRGYLLTIDYGYSAAKYYRPARSQGTLQCYYQHRRHNNPYANLGHQDITTHVDFTALERTGEKLDLKKIGFTQQGLFLMSLGLGDRLNELSSGKFTITEIFKRRDALHQLLEPTGLGGYGVLIQGKNLTEAESSLRGLKIPELS